MAEQIWDTPGYYYAISYWLSVTVQVLISRNGRDFKKVCAAGILSLPALLFLLATTQGVEGIGFAAVMFTVLGIMFFYIWFPGGMDLINVVFNILKAFIVAEFAASLCWQITYYFYNSMTLRGRIVLMLVIYTILCLFHLHLEHYFIANMVDITLNWKEMAVLGGLILILYVMSNLSYVTPNTIFSGTMAADVFNIRTLFDLVGVIIVYSFQLQLQEMQTRFEKDTLKSIMNMQYQSYQLSSESIDVVNQKYHDLKHQITLLMAEANSEKSARNLERMQKEIRLYETQNKTGNRVLDALLAVKSLYCQNNGIELKFIADGSLLSFMDEMDISALFGNMLDNAIESVEKLPDADKRLIRMYVSEEKKFLRIRMENYCEENIRFRDGMPLTTKKDKHLHGYGMKSMKKTVERYGGSVKASLSDNWFRLMILIPLPQDS